KRFPTPNTHGTGCTCSACITSELAKGISESEAVQTAKNYIAAAISHPLGIGAGHGPVNQWAYRDE
ncbi:bifunctional hydroxymethylpyrimidine kinase/phosphomethylpyrimidine kinase, partial [Neisseria sp. P0001.S006]|uniref:bifunctional hydroxymethylpyrimidine kinase/phosphomethylpyrimidine kinase n=1 Tax=Neisseria sp. P0001.S006 TaxID=3436650 RepID=UPI003F7E7A6B